MQRPQSETINYTAATASPSFWAINNNIKLHVVSVRIMSLQYCCKKLKMTHPNSWSPQLHIPKSALKLQQETISTHSWNQSTQSTRTWQQTNIKVRFIRRHNKTDQTPWPRTIPQKPRKGLNRKIHLNQNPWHKP